MSAATLPAKTPVPERARNQRFITAFQAAVLVVLFSTAALQEARHLQSLTDTGVWLQLRVGNWILDHHAVPHSGLFSRLDTRNWVDSTWGSQVILAALYRAVGLRALPVMLMLLRILVAVAAFLLAGGRRSGFWFAAVISACAQIALFRPITEPLLYDALLFSVELWALFASRAKGRRDLLLWMPLLVLVWTNLDWRFVFGLLVLLLFLLAETIEERWRNKTGAPIVAPFLYERAAMIAAASCVASLLSPYSYHSYAVARQNWFGETELTLTPEMKPMSFHTPEHYLLMLLAMFAFLALGRRQVKDLFSVMLLAGSVCIGFAFQREAWTVVVTSVAILGEVFFPAGDRPDELSRSPKPALWPAAIVVVIIFVASVLSIPTRTETLLDITAKNLPVRACDFIKQNHLPTPIFNELSWGDFLIWYLPDYPVSMDDRSELYGEENVTLYNQVTTAKRLSSEDSSFTSANTILISTDNGLMRVPEMFPNPDEVFQAAFPGFKQVYRDEMAVVLSKQ